MFIRRGLRLNLPATLCCALTVQLLQLPRVVAQTPQEPKNTTDVVKVFTQLVQTDVMVFDKQGKFARDLKREDFELRIDGKPRPIEFFERITAGSVNEERQLAAARGSNSSKERAGATIPLDRGRTIFFYVDDLHLDQQGAHLTRKTITKFLDDEMGQNDEVAIASSSGLIGFLQQLTDNRIVLQKALERIRPHGTSVLDMERPLMKEYQALSISRYDRETTDYFIDAIIRENPTITREAATSMVQSRARQILVQGSNITRNTLSGLESLVRTTAQLPGRKVVFFISNGFFLDAQNSDTLERLKRITSASARSGVIIYSMDARGLVASLSDISASEPVDVSGRYERSLRGELLATQDGMNALARDTGGRPFFNTNSFDASFKQALSESSTYYLLAWKPEPNSDDTSRFRKIEVKLLSKPGLTVRVRRGFYDIEPTQPVNAKKDAKKPTVVPKTPTDELQAVISSAFPARTLPVSLSLSHMNTASKGEMLSASMQVPREFLTFGANGDSSKASVDVVGFIYDERGRVGSKFGERITITARAQEGTVEGLVTTSPTDLIYNHPIAVAPGLYHVRVAARDVATGKAGSAQGWIEVPNVAAGELAMSSLLIGERTSGMLTNTAAAETVRPDISLNVSRRFHHDSFLRFLFLVYNAGRAGDGKPDAAAQVQIVRDGQPVMTTALRRINPEGIADLARLPYAAEIPLQELPAGRYVLSVTVVDKITKRSATQRTKFEVY